MLGLKLTHVSKGVPVVNLAPEHLHPSWANQKCHNALLYSDVTTVQWRHNNHQASQITCTRLFVQACVQVNMEENTKARVSGPLWGESTGDRWIPSQRASNAKKVSIEWRHYGTRWSKLLVRSTTFIQDTIRKWVQHMKALVMLWQFDSLQGRCISQRWQKIVGGHKSHCQW